MIKITYSLSVIILTASSLVGGYYWGVSDEKARDKTILTWENRPSLVKIEKNKVCYGWEVKNCTRPHNVYECHFVN